MPSNVTKGRNAFGMLKLPFVICFSVAAAVATISPLGIVYSATADAAPFPAGANVLNIREFGAKGDGVTDDTQAILQAIRQLPAFDVHHPWQTKIVYFPDGTYLISNTIQRRDDTGRYLPGLVIIGQSQKDTIIKLADRAPGYQNPSVAKSMIFTSSGLLGGDPRAGGKDPSKGEGNDAYVNTVENLTLEVGRGNEGAIGLDYLANNIGAVRDVTIRAVDRARTGLLMTRQWMGPALIQRVSIVGFDVGVDLNHTEYSVTLDDVTVRKSRSFGLRNDSNSVQFSNLTIDAEAGVGIANVGRPALIAGIKATVSGRGEAAFQNTGSANLQSVSITGFTQNSKPNNSGSLDGVFDGEKRIADSRWSIPIQSRSITDESSSDEWVNIQSFGAVADPRVDSTKAISAAFHSGAKTIFFPTGQYKISGSIAIPASVEKVEGLFSTVFTDPSLVPSVAAGRYPAFVTESRSRPFALRRLIVENRNGSYAVLEHPAASPAILQDIVAFAVGLLVRPAEGGSVFAENISGTGGIKLAGPAGVWFRQLNVEAHGTMIESNATPLWVLGAKTEQTLTLVDARNQADTEVVGGLVYRVDGEATDIPLFIVSDSRLLASYAEEAFTPNAVYSFHAQAKLNGQDVSVRAADLPLRGQFGRMVRQLDVGR